MMWVPVMWLLVGAIIGVVHATALWHAAQRPSGWIAITGGVRLLAVALVLTGAAVWGGLLPAAAGWAMGFVVGGVVVFLRTALLSHKPAAGASGEASATESSEPGKV